MTRPTLRRTVAPAIALLALALGLTGCDASTSPASSASETPPATSDATAEPTESTEPVTIPVTCDTLMTPDAYAKLADDGLEPRQATLFDPIALRIADEGGLVCSWGKPQTDVTLDVAQVPAGDEATWTAALADAGYEQGDDPVAGGWVGPADAGNGMTPVVVIADGTVTWFNSPTFAGDLRPTS
ncbi:hypothetical protein GCM10009819_16520 [Agromyces tropicus]|uniref:Uncharacterized protein n=1 Tax=Agromyces tropicus TaxID=555371 RepID=A0ABP5FVY1_9MICO